MTLRIHRRGMIVGGAARGGTGRTVHPARTIQTLVAAHSRAHGARADRKRHFAGVQIPRPAQP